MCVKSASSNSAREGSSTAPLVFVAKYDVRRRLIPRSISAGSNRTTRPMRMHAMRSSRAMTSTVLRARSGIYAASSGVSFCVGYRHIYDCMPGRGIVRFPAGAASSGVAWAQVARTLATPYPHGSKHPAAANVWP